jgi:N-acetylglutamate synthase-like GNAT family acetyltransferase
VRLTVRRLDPDMRAELGRIGPEANGSRPDELLDEAAEGYLLAADGDPACWCRTATNGKPELITLTSFHVAPIYRHRHFALKLLEGVLDDLRAQGLQVVEATPERGESLDHLELWDVTDDVFHEAGFEVVRDDPVLPVLRREL